LISSDLVRRTRVIVYLSATCAHLLRQLGRSREAELAYRHGMTLTSNPVERRYLQDRAQSWADE
jgi:predicted RNA polymerase sigma factor